MRCTAHVLLELLLQSTRPIVYVFMYVMLIMDCDVLSPNVLMRGVRWKMVTCDMPLLLVSQNFDLLIIHFGILTTLLCIVILYNSQEFGCKKLWHVNSCGCTCFKYIVLHVEEYTHAR